jgi:hypothetical protein
MRRVVPGANGPCREATLNTRLLTLLRGDDGETTSLRFADVPKPTVFEGVAAATMRTALRRRRLAPSPNRTTVTLIELRDRALKSVQLGRDGVQRHSLGSGVGEGRSSVESVDSGRAMLGGKMITARDGRPRDAWTAYMLALEQNNSVEVGVN